MKRPAQLLMVPLLAVIVCGMVIPGALILYLSLFPTSSAGKQHQLGLGAFHHLFSAYRGGIVAHTLLLSLAATLLLVPVVLSVSAVLRLRGKRKIIVASEFLMIAPFFVSPALRLHALETLLAKGGLCYRLLCALGCNKEAVGALLFSDIGVVTGLCFSYSAFLVLPILQSFMATDEGLVWALRDTSQGPWTTVRFLVAWNRPAIVGGVLLMTSSAWFSALEYQILGRSRSILGVVDGLVGVTKYAECYALTLIPCAATLASFLIVAYMVDLRLLFQVDTEGA